MPSDSVRVGVLALHESKESKAILNAVEALGHEPEYLRGENTVVGLEDGAESSDPDVDVVANRLLLSSTGQPNEELGVAQTLSRLRPILNPPAATASAAREIATATALATEGVPVPDAVLALPGEEPNRVRDIYGPEAAYKTAIGTHGGGAWKVGEAEAITRRSASAARSTMSSSAGPASPPPTSACTS